MTILYRCLRQNTFFYSGHQGHVIDNRYFKSTIYPYVCLNCRTGLTHQKSSKSQFSNTVTSVSTKNIYL